MLDRSVFAQGYKQLCSAFGRKENLDQMKTWYEILKKKVSNKELPLIIEDLIGTQDRFPSVAHIVGRCTVKDSLMKEKVYLCRMKDCDQGYLLVPHVYYLSRSHPDAGGADLGVESIMAYRCPVCCAVPVELGIETYSGKINDKMMYSPKEFKERVKKLTEYASRSERFEMVITPQIRDYLSNLQ